MTELSLQFTLHGLRDLRAFSRAVGVRDRCEPHRATSWKNESIDIAPAFATTFTGPTAPTVRPSQILKYEICIRQRGTFIETLG